MQPVSQVSDEAIPVCKVCILLTPNPLSQFLTVSLLFFVHMMKSERCFLRRVESVVFALRVFYTC